MDAGCWLFAETKSFSHSVHAEAGRTAQLVAKARGRGGNRNKRESPVARSDAAEGAKKHGLERRGDGASLFNSRERHVALESLPGTEMGT